MKERRLILDQQLRQFEAEKASIAEAILEINRRLAVLDEVESRDGLMTVLAFSE